VAAAGGAEEDRQLVAGQLAATAGEDRRQARRSQTCVWTALKKRDLPRLDFSSLGEIVA
jgi:hypothetical protein